MSAVMLRVDQRQLAGLRLVPRELRRQVLGMQIRSQRRRPVIEQVAIERRVLPVVHDRYQDEIDTLLGCVLTYSDEMFNEALRIGFASAIQREWAWREKRGESLANLRPFAALLTDSDGTTVASPSDHETGPA